VASAGVPAELAFVLAGALVTVAAILVARGRARDAGRTDESPRRVAAALRFVGGPLAGQSFALDADVTTLGSLAGATIVLPDPDIARKHAAIRRHVGAWTTRPRSEVQYELADLGSQKGVLVNGQRMAKRVLASGDIIRLGTSEMVFRIEKVG
jgi:hypothetical protein